MAPKKSELDSSTWQSCDELRGGMDASQCQDAMLPQHYPIDAGVLFAGEYPGDRNPEIARARILGLVEMGVRTFKQGMMQELLTGRTRLVASPQKGGRA